MPLKPFPVDYAAIRQAMARAIQLATGLDTNSVLQMQAAGPAATRPDAPFAEFMLTSLGQPLGRDARHQAEGALPVTYRGMRQMTAQFQFFGRSSDEAFGLAGAWVAGLYDPAVNDLLDEVGGVAVWRVDGPTNISQLSAAAYEARAAVNATFGVCSVSYATVGPIRSVPVSGPDIAIHVDSPDGAVDVGGTVDGYH